MAMPKRYFKIINLIMVVMVVTALIGVGIALYIQNYKIGDKIEISSDGVTTKTLEVNDLNLIPGQEKEYVLNLNFDDYGKYYLTITFSNLKNGSTLQNFIDVSVTIGSQTASGSLADYFTPDGKIKFDYVLTDGRGEDLKILFKLPAEVGDEAQGAVAKFDINLTVNTELSDMEIE